MRTGHLLFSAIHFFMVFLILGMGIFFMALPKADLIRTQLAQWVENPGMTSLWVGGGTFGFGVILFISAWILNRRQYLQIEMGGFPVDVDEKIIRRCAETYFKSRFPYEEFVSDVILKGKSTIEVLTSLPHPQKPEFLEEVEKELSAVLSRRLGYQRRFTVTFVEN